MRWRWLTWTTAATLYAIGLWTVPHWWCEREAERWFAGDATAQERLARGAERWIRQELGREHFQTGSAQFNGEWLFGTYLMAGLGFGQSALEHPEWRDRHLELMNLCVERIMSPAVRAFDRETWGSDPLESLDSDEHDHAAYLGYFNLLLGLQRRLDPASPYAPLHDRITAALARRLEKRPWLLLHSYPDEMYPVDNGAVIGSIGLHGQYPAVVRRWVDNCRQRYIDPQTGLLYQCIDPRSGVAVDAPRGSGTALGLYFLSFADRALARDLYAAARRELAGTLLGFGVVREYPRGHGDGTGDIDSGPIVLGYGVSATGFSLAGSRMNGDAATFRRLFGTAYLFGAPVERSGRREYVMGGPLGNAILFAMLTAQR